MSEPLITLLTDFGADAYLAMLQGRLLSLLPGCRLIDLGHQPPSGDAEADLFRSALRLRRAYSYYPAGTIHLVGQDYGGDSERALVAAAGGHLFLAPDSGVLGPALENEAAGGATVAVHAAPLPATATFLARDVLAPWAARLAAGTPLAALGERVEDWRRLALPQPRALPDGIHGQVLHVDVFGNVLTNLTRANVASDVPGSAPARLHIAGTTVARWRQGYAGALAGELFLLWGAEGWLEIALARGSAAARLGAQPGMEVVLR